MALAGRAEKLAVGADRALGGVVGAAAGAGSQTGGAVFGAYDDHVALRAFSSVAVTWAGGVAASAVGRAG